MNKVLVLFLVPSILAVTAVREEIDDEGDAEVDQALQPFWDLLLTKVTLFSETWSQRIKEVMRSLAYPKGHHHKCPDHHKHLYSDRMGEDTTDEDIDGPVHERNGEIFDQVPSAEQQDNSEDE